MGGAYLYILRCADGSYYVGTTIAGLELRLAEHQAGTFGGYTARRRPVELVFHEHFERLEDAAAAEQQVKGWRRDKKEGPDPRRLRCAACALSPGRNGGTSFRRRATRASSG
jgi:putative endonuclease